MADRVKADLGVVTILVNAAGLARRELLGGLLGAYIGVEVTKKLVGIGESTGDQFAPAVALGLAIGRIGCFLTEQLGTPTNLPWAMTMNETGVSLTGSP